MELTNELLDAAHWVADEAMLFQHDESPFRAQVHAGDPRLVLVVGENAEGKSLFLRILAMKLKQDADEAGTSHTTVSISIRERTGGGTSDMGRIAQAFMFGEEREQSTGATSARVVDTAFRKNLDRDDGAQTLLALDEPEMGLSDGYARAMGELIAVRAAVTPKNCLGTVVVSHSRSLVNGIIDTPGVPGDAPTFVHVGPNREQDLYGWLSYEEHCTLADLLALHAVGHDRWRTTLNLTRSNS